MMKDENNPKNILGSPNLPKKGKKGGFGGPKTPPQNIFWVIFIFFFILFALSAFQDFFNFHFTMILRDFMTILKIFAFFCKNLGILLNKNVFSVPNRNRY